MQAPPLPLIADTLVALDTLGMVLTFRVLGPHRGLSSFFLLT